jgi:hypothetical protein
VATKPLTEAEAIWNEIKNKGIDVFGIPNQTVSFYCVPAVVEPSKCYLTVKAGAVLPALETALGSKFAFELVMNGKYIVVSRKVD